MDVNKTRLISSPSFGNGLTPTEDIAAGSEIIKITNPLLILVEQASLSTTCSYCFLPASSNPTPLKRCAACKIPHYCSSGCQKNDWVHIHSKECKILKTLPRCPPTPVRALMQMLLKHKYAGSPDPAWRDLEGHVERFRRERGKRWEEFILQARGAVEFAGKGVEALEMATGLLCRMATNAFRVTTPDDSPFGLCFSPPLALVNHSCSPNAHIMFNGRTVSLRAISSIKAGEQIFISYIDPLQSRETRRRELDDRYFFVCGCGVCQSDETVYDTVLRMNKKESNNKGKEDGIISIWWDTAEHLKQASQLTTLSETINFNALQSSKIQQLIEQSRLTDSPSKRFSILTTVFTSLKPLSSQTLYAIPPIPGLLNEFYLHYLSTESYIEAVIILLFISQHLDPYTYPIITHPIRVVRLSTIATLLKHVALLPTSTILPPSSTPFNIDQQDRIRNIDYTSAGHVFLIFAKELGRVSHGAESRFVKQVEADLEDVEAVQKQRGDGRVGVELKRWMVQGDMGVEGKLMAETLLGGLRELVGFIGKVVPGLEM